MEEEVKEKSCSRCGEIKPLEEFHKDPTGIYSRHSRCKKCKSEVQKQYGRESMAKYRAKNPEKVRLYTRMYRIKNNTKITKRRKKYREVNADHIEQMRLRRRESGPEKFAARNILNNAVRAGKVVRADYCEYCGSMQYIDAHHEDYSKPLEVVWLCKSCHQLLHKGKNSAATA